MDERNHNSTDVKSIIDTQLKQFYSNIARERDNQVKVRNWSITIWLAFIAILTSGKIAMNLASSAFILIFINLIFWAIEGLHHTIVFIDSTKARKLEKILAGKELPNFLPLHLFYASSFNTVSKKEKIHAFFASCFKSETVFLFYLTMIISSILFVSFIKTKS